MLNSFARLAMAAAATALTFAPATTEAQARFGTLLGASITTISDVNPFDETGVVGDAIKQKSKAGFQLGGFVRLPLAGAVSLQPELHYIQKGTKLSASDVEFGDAEVSIKLGYVEVPVLLRLDLGSSAVHPFIVAGPSVALRTSCKIAFDIGSLGGGSANCDEGELEDGESADDPFKKTDFGGIVGAGLVGSLGGRSVSAQVRYSRGLTSVAKEDIPGATPRNTGFSIVFGLGF